MHTNPAFARFATAFQQGRHDEALSHIDALIAAHPQSPALHWHRANCMEKLERYDEIVPALDRLLALKPDYAPAIVKRVQFAAVDAGDVEDDEDEDDDLPDAERARREAEQRARALRASLQAEAELRRALAIDPNLVDGLFVLSNTLRYRDDGGDHSAEADALLDRAIELAPLRIDLLDARAALRRSAATRYDDGPDDADTIKPLNGIRYSRSRLEAALADYDAAWALGGEYRHAVRRGMLLHDLGRYDEALAAYDEALALIPVDDPKRAFIVETRARSENNGAGEREQMARLIETALLGDGKDRNLQDDVAAQAMLSAAQAIRSGKSVTEAIETRVSEDPDVLMATNIAQQILNVAHEPPPQLEAVDPAGYPVYQRKYVDRVARDAESIGLRQVGDGEAKGLFLMLGQHVLLRFFADESGEIGVAAFALKPKWPGLVAFLFLLLTGKWRVHRMLECVTQFDDGTHLSTQYENPSVFEFGGNVQIERMPTKTPLRDLVARHAERVAAYKSAHPQAVAMTADDLDGMERRWREGQRVKRAYRAAIGYVTDAELKRLLGMHHGRFGDKVKAQLALLAEDASGQG
jgi:tetratricopeptide (TPR) repeat protein